MSKRTGLWIAIGGGSLAEAIDSSIESYGQFTTTVSAPDVKPRGAELAIVSLNGARADYIGISQAGRRVATGQMTIAVSNLLPLKRLSRDKIRSKLPRRFSSHFAPPHIGVYRPTPRLWEEVLTIVTSEIPERSEKISDLMKIIAGATLPSGRVEGGLEVFERDAIASALQTWRGTPLRKRVLRRAVPNKQVPVAPFLFQLKAVSIREDPQISHDHATFPGMEIAQRHMVGSIVLHDGDEYLTILNCNRQPLEQTLGVDLIYYNHRFDSFVLVQYKRMAEDTQGAVYRPEHDQSHGKELQRMAEAEKLLMGLPHSNNYATDTFRLSGHGFYVKLCESKAKAALDSGMVSGMYLPLELWRRILNSPAVRGPRGGIAITWENCTRRLNNSEFTNLLRHGWIGSAAGHSKMLAQIIGDVLGSRRMLILAATSAAPPSRDLRRDNLGRFAAEDDPTGAI
jgi:hypothetical protein